MLKNMKMYLYIISIEQLTNIDDLYCILDLKLFSAISGLLLILNSFNKDAYLFQFFLFFILFPSWFEILVIFKYIIVLQQYQYHTFCSAYIRITRWIEIEYKYIFGICYCSNWSKFYVISFFLMIISNYCLENISK